MTLGDGVSFGRQVPWIGQVDSGPQTSDNGDAGGVPERLIGSVLKTDNIERCSRVRIPPPPLVVCFEWVTLPSWVTFLT